jgi:hypothetical protein
MGFAFCIVAIFQIFYVAITDYRRIMPYIVLPLHSWLYFQMTTRTQQRPGNLLNAHKHEKQEETPQCSKVEEEEDQIYGSVNSISKQK